MKLLPRLFTALSLLNPIFAYAIKTNLNPGLSLFPRGIIKDTNPSDTFRSPRIIDPESKFGVVSDDKTSTLNIMTAIQDLPKHPWFTYALSKAQAFGRLIGLYSQSQADLEEIHPEFQADPEEPHPEFQADPEKLYEVNQFGFPISLKEYDLTNQVHNLKVVPQSKGTMWVLKIL